MDKETALKVLIDVAILSQKAGVLSLQDARTVLIAIETLQPSSEKEVTQIKKEEKKK
jgi:hypothetical protein